MQIRRCVVCGRRLRWWNHTIDVKEYGTPREVHRYRRPADTTYTCLEVFAIGVEVGMGDIFFDTSELQ